MIVILSYEGDAATSEIIDWLDRLGCAYQRINLANEDFRNIFIEFCDGKPISTKLLLRNGRVLDIAEVNHFLFRGGLFSFNQQHNVTSELPTSIAKVYLRYEFDSLTKFFYKQVASKCLGNPLLHPLNKLEQLEAAHEAGFKIPGTAVVGSRKMLANSNLKAEKILLTKAIQENIFISKNSYFYDIKASEIEVSDLEDFFYPSLFQKSVDKSLEVRAFYLDGKFYALGMLLCSSKGRVVDFRTKTKEIRYCRYKLPAVIESSLEQVMKSLNLNTGSIDLLVDPDNVYYFLEVNPTGQFGWVSDFGNYCIERKIAEYLIAKDETFKKY